MKTIKTVLIIFAFLILHFIFSIQLSAADTWTKTYNPFCEEYVPNNGWIELEVDYVVEDVLVTQDGGYVVSGSFDRWIDDEPPFWFDHWGFLMKTDCDGNLLWAKGDSVVFLSENDNYACVETEDGDLISVGYCYWGGGYMIKRDSEGNRLWAIPYNDFGANSMCQTNDGNVVLGGVIESEIALRKLDLNGNTLWTKSYNCGYTSIAQSITQTYDNGFALTGLASGNRYDIIVMKTDENGDSLWTRTFDGYGYYIDQGNCVIETLDDNILVCGSLDHPPPIYSYGFIGKFGNTGDTIFIHQLEGLNIRSCLQDDDNNYVIYSGGAMLKTNDEGDTLWYNALPYWGNGGDRCFQKVSNGFLCLGKTYNAIILTKTDSNGQITAIDDPSNPNNNLLISLFPNPITNNCTITLYSKISLKNPTIMIYNIKGQLVKELHIENYKLGIHEINWDGKSFNGKEVHNGIYFLKLESDNYRAVKKVTKIK